MNFLDGYGYTPHNLDMPDFGKDAEKIEADEPVVPIARPGTTLPEPASAALLVHSREGLRPATSLQTKA